MAEKRMLTRKVTDDDLFIGLSASAQALYLHLSMAADDDGFCKQVSTCMFRAHASISDLEALLSNRYIYQFENGVIVIRHWRMANALRKDRYTPTIFQTELEKLELDNVGAYELVANRLPDGCQTVANCPPQIRLDKNRLDKSREEESNNTLTLTGSSICATDFERFWSAYPKKRNKETARKAFKKLKGVSIETLLEAIEKQKRSQDWLKDGGQFIPYPATWLNAGGWENEETETNVPAGLERYSGLARLMEEMKDD
jgi:hypothetical protein